ncbi:transcription initiation factor TFIID subunit 4-like [Eucyclogobius newberryi]|uniref:transcription initiation factor TFIID subunit 4-like n=1 Tax=Eucyclogobius newberryi TaxID=166745 RepID=UPI003B5AE014
MAGASDPLEDMLFTEVDEKAVSDLVGSLESQLGDRKPPAAPFADGKARDTAAAGQFSGKVRERAAGASTEQPPSQQPQQGHPKAGSNREPTAATADGPALPGGAPAASTAAGAAGAPVLSVAAQPSAPAPFHPTVVPAPPLAPPPVQAGLQSLNGAPGSVKLISPALPPPPPQPGTVINAVSGSTVMTSAFAAQSPTAITLQRHPGPVPNQNGVDPKSSPNAPTSQVLNHTNQLIHNKILPQAPPASGNSVILANTPPLTTQIAQTGAAQAVGGVKPALNGLPQPAVAVVRPPGAGVAATGVQQQRPVLGVNAATTRAPAPQANIAVRPQQQTTIQLPPGFSMPPGMVLVRTETGQLVMVPQQVLAQAQAKTQQNQTTVNIQRPATPTAAGGAIRVSAPATAPGTSTVRLASPQTRLTQPASVQKAISAAPGGSAVSVKMSTPQKAPTVITAGGTVLNKTSPAAQPARVNVVSQEMQENVKKCKNFLATLIKLASHNSPSPDTSKNVKSLVQDLLDAKIEPEEFTTRLQAELKSSPQPYLIPFLKKSLPALRQSLLSSQQSLITVPNTGAAAPTLVTPGTVTTTTTTTIRPPMPISPATSAVRLGAPMGVAVGRPGVQTISRPVVISQNLRPQGTLIRGPTTILGKSPIMAAQANQKKLSDPGGGTFRDDDDINDVASMAGVNLNEENARILATSSELVGTMIRSCKDEAFLPPGMLHRRVLEIAKKSGVSEIPVDVVNLISHATQSRLRTLLEKVSVVAQHRTDGGKDEDHYEQTSDVRSQLRFFEQLERMEKQRKDEQEREILLKAAKSRARQEDPEQARLKQKAKEMQQQELAQMRQRDANLTALAAIGPRRKRRLDSPGGATAGAESASGSGSSSSPASSRQQLRQRITRVNLRDFIFCLEQERTTTRSLTLYKALLK